MNLLRCFPGRPTVKNYVTREKEKLQLSTYFYTFYIELSEKNRESSWVHSSVQSQVVKFSFFTNWYYANPRSTVCWLMAMSVKTWCLQKNFRSRTWAEHAHYPLGIEIDGWLVFRDRSDIFHCLSVLLGFFRFASSCSR